ncbi:hypothetical protein [Paracoccus sp. PAMC 22219]|uniref:hypothetical protein n=1 Tax=Paracoccus sp. PAMC 22219 TaxID=1569209 RepID=UPI0005A6F4E1|nr:hypothetical protein [Paracoccus sp. PAMC 22219]
MAIDAKSFKERRSVHLAGPKRADDRRDCLMGQTKDALQAKLHAVMDATGRRLRSCERQKSFLLHGWNMTVAAKAISERQVSKDPP